MGKIIFWSIVTGWLLVGLVMAFTSYHRVSLRPKFDEHPVAMFLACIVGGPAIIIFGVIAGTIEYFKGRKNGKK